MKHIKLFENYIANSYTKYYIVLMGNPWEPLETGQTTGKSIYLLELLKVKNKIFKKTRKLDIIIAFRAMEYTYTNEEIKSSQSINFYYDNNNHKFYREGFYTSNVYGTFWKIDDDNGYINQVYELEILWKGDDKNEAFNKVPELASKYLVRSSELDELENLIKSGEFDVNKTWETWSDGSITTFTPLKKAVRDHELETIRLLIKYGANVDQQTNGGETALMLAAYWENIKIMQELIKSGANLLIQDNDKEIFIDYISDEKIEEEITNFILDNPQLPHYDDFNIYVSTKKYNL